ALRVVAGDEESARHVLALQHVDEPRDAAACGIAPPRMGTEWRNPASHFMAGTIEVDAEGYRAAQIVWKPGSFQDRLIVMSASRVRMRNPQHARIAKV